MPILTPDLFERSYFEIGSGTCLEPLLRFSDKFSEFLFIDFELYLAEVENFLRKSIDAVRSCTRIGSVPALVLDRLEVFQDLRMPDIELHTSVRDTLRTVRELCGMEGFEYFDQTVKWANPNQWAIRAFFTRNIRHVDGSYLKRALTLWLVGGEGTLTYVGMGGMCRPPKYVGTIQTGLAEQCEGPIGKIFRHQKSSGGILPKVWIRGRATKKLDLDPAEPFPERGQVFGGWQSDRSFPRAIDPMRKVAAWIERSPALCPHHFGKHTLVPHKIDVREIGEIDTVSLPYNLASVLGVSGRRNVRVASNNVPWMQTASEKLREWQDSPEFIRGKNAALVFAGSEDECAVVVRWLAQFDNPPIRVYLPMPLDYSTFVGTIDLERS